MQHRKAACAAADAARLRLKPSQPTYSNNECPSQEATTADRAKAGDCTPKRVLVEKEEETIEEMVRRMEMELDVEFRHLFPAAAATKAAEVPEQRVPEAVTELEDLEIEINRRSVKVAYMRPLF